MIYSDLYGSFNDGQQTLGFIRNNKNVKFDDGRRETVMIIKEKYDIRTDKTITDYDICIAEKPLGYCIRVIR